MKRSNRIAWFFIAAQDDSVCRIKRRSFRSSAVRREAPDSVDFDMTLNLSDHP